MSFDRKFILKSGSYSTLEIMSNQILGLISFFILVRVMPKSDFGIWVLYLSTTTFLEQARIGFLRNGFIKYLAGSDISMQKNILSASVILNILLFIFTAIITLLLAFYVGPVIWGEKILTSLFLWYIPYSFFLSFYLQFKMMEQAHLDFRGSFLTALFRRLFFIIAIIYLIVFRPNVDLLTLTYLHVCSIAIGALIAFYLSRNKFRFEFKFQYEWLSKLTSFGVFTFGTNMGSMLLRNIDQFMLGTFSDKVYLALYNSAVRISSLIEIPTNAMSSIVYPKGVSMVKNNRQSDLKDMYERSVAIIFIFVLPIVIVVLLIPQLFILIVAGSEYLEAVPYLRITILFALFVPFMRQGGTVLDSMGKPKVNFYLTLFAAIVNIISNIIFINSFGPIGAAYGTLVAYSFIVLVNQYFLRKILKIQTGNILRYVGLYYWKGAQMAIKLIKK
jgi:lipopolysaccharide exporter